VQQLVIVTSIQPGSCSTSVVVLISADRAELQPGLSPSLGSFEPQPELCQHSLKSTKPQGIAHRLVANKLRVHDPIQLNAWLSWLLSETASGDVARMPGLTSAGG